MTITQDYFPDDTTAYNTDEITRLYLIRASVLFYILGLVAIGLCLIVGIIGCWRRSPRMILATALLMLFAGIHCSLFHRIYQREGLRSESLCQG